MTTIPAILAAVATEYSVTVEEIVGPGGKRRTTLPRQVVIYLARTETPKWSLRRIGEAVGRRGTSALAHGAATIEAALWRDAELLERVDRIRRRMASESVGPMPEVLGTPPKPRPKPVRPVKPNPFAIGLVAVAQRDEGMRRVVPGTFRVNGFSMIGGRL